MSPPPLPPGWGVCVSDVRLKKCRLQVSSSFSLHPFTMHGIGNVRKIWSHSDVNNSEALIQEERRGGEGVDFLNST